MATTSVRIGQAAEMLGVSVDTVRRWIVSGRLTATRTGGGQRQVDLRSISARLAESRRLGGQAGRAAQRPTIATSARNRFPGIVTRIERDRVVAVVEVQAGPHRLVSLMTAEAVDELGLAVGSEAVCVVKATHVIVDLPGR